MRPELIVILICFAGLCRSNKTAICDSARSQFASRDDIEIICADNSTTTFENAWLNWNWGTDTSDQVPSAVLFLNSERAVSTAMRWISKENIPFAVRAGRHDYQGFSLAERGGVILDTSNLSTISVYEISLPQSAMHTNAKF